MFPCRTTGREARPATFPFQLRGGAAGSGVTVRLRATRKSICRQNSLVLRNSSVQQSPQLKRNPNVVSNKSNRRSKQSKTQSNQNVFQQDHRPTPFSLASFNYESPLSVLLFFVFLCVLCASALRTLLLFAASAVPAHRVRKLICPLETLARAITNFPPTAALRT